MQFNAMPRFEDAEGQPERDGGHYAPAVPGGGPRQDLVEGAKNLLKHIPGEASGFYLMAADAFEQPDLGTLWVIFAMALVILLVVRWAAGASRAIVLTTIGAFLVWMLVLDKGVLHVAFPDLLPDPMGLIVAVFYSVVITAVTSTGKLS